MNNPLFSIIVVCLNAEQYIETTLNSILSQTYSNYEVIVKDGLSKDNTLQLIPQNDKIKIYSKKDSGIYDAMNQAIGEATGDYLFFLNCGDVFYDNNVLEKVNDCIHLNSLEQSKAIVYGSHCSKGQMYQAPKNITGFTLFRTHLTHQTMFFSKRLFDELGLYDLRYIICSDYEYTVKCFKNNVKFQYVDAVICNYLGDGFSTRKDLQKKSKNEHKDIISRYYSKAEIRKNKFKLFLSMQKFRIWCASDKSPKFIRKLYRKIANGVNNKV